MCKINSQIQIKTRLCCVKQNISKTTKTKHVQHTKLNYVIKHAISVITKPNKTKNTLLHFMHTDKFIHYENVFFRNRDRDYFTSFFSKMNQSCHRIRSR